MSIRNKRSSVIINNCTLLSKDTYSISTKLNFCSRLKVGSCSTCNYCTNSIFTVKLYISSTCNCYCRSRFSIRSFSNVDSRSSCSSISNINCSRISDITLIFSKQSNSVFTCCDIGSHIFSLLSICIYPNCIKVIQSVIAQY